MNKDPEKESTSAPEKENWGRGFRRPSGGEPVSTEEIRHSVEPARADGEVPGQAPRANASGRGNSCSGERTIPWANGRSDIVAMDDVIEDTEDEED